MLRTPQNGRESSNAAPILAPLTALVCVLSLFCGCTAGTPVATTPPGSSATPSGVLFTPLEGQGEVANPDDPLILRSRPVQVNLELLTDAHTGEVLEANLFSDVVLNVVLESREATGSGGIAWTGHVVGVDGSQVTFVIGGGQMAGNIVLPDAHYQIRYLPEGHYIIREINPSAFPPDEPPA